MFYTFSISHLVLFSSKKTHLVYHCEFIVAPIASWESFFLFLTGPVGFHSDHYDCANYLKFRFCSIFSKDGNKTKLPQQLGCQNNSPPPPMFLFSDTLFWHLKLPSLATACVRFVFFLQLLGIHVQTVWYVFKIIKRRRLMLLTLYQHVSSYLRRKTVYFGRPSVHFCDAVRGMDGVQKPNVICPRFCFLPFEASPV